MIYRSGALELMTPPDVELLSNGLAVHTILDLRHPTELEMYNSAHALHDRVVALSTFPENVRQEDLIAELNGLYGPGPSPRRYMHYLSVGGDRLAQSFEVFANPDNYPVLVHCTAGKDRTGVLIGMLMDVLGCADADIAEEYRKSDDSIDALLAYLRSTGRQLEGTDEEIRARLSTPAAHMAGFITLLRENYGSAESYFREHGVKPDTFERVRSILTA
jgi:rhodanese-related sulfurtransferase